MILPGLCLNSRANFVGNHCGMDSFDLCFDIDHFINYPYKIHYQFNQRGFRDEEWPNDLNDVIWCIGDSFTVGIGNPIEHTWPNILQTKTLKKTINVGMEGASNNWIARTALTVLSQFPTAQIVVHWSFQQRRERSIDSVLAEKFPDFYRKVKDDCWLNYDFSQYNAIPEAIRLELENKHQWPPVIYDDERILHYDWTSDQSDAANTEYCRNILPSNVIETSIPNWKSPNCDIVYEQCFETVQLDTGRDGFHYGPMTASSVVGNILATKKL